MKFKFTNKKYAIRKLTMGVASIAIGTILWGGGYTLSGNSTLGTNIAYAACNTNYYYFLNHYDEYETVYEADGTLAKGEHKVAREVNEGRQLFQIVPINCSYEPYPALGDDELFHKPYEVITNKSNVAKEYELKTLDNNKKDHRTEEDDTEEAKLWDRYMNSPGEFFFETRTRKKVLLNKDENVTEPINNEDGSITIPSHSVSKKYKNRKDEMKEFSIGTIDENYLNKEHHYDDNVYIRNTYNKYVKDYFKLVKVGNVERIPISTTAIETDYVANNTLDYGVRNTTNQGKEGLRENVVTYEVDRNTGALKNSTTVENTIPMEKKIVEVGTKEKVVYSKKGNDVIKTTTTYELNTTTGEVTPKSIERIYNAGGVAPKEIVEEIPKTITYIADENLHYGTRNVEQAGENGKKVTTTTYEVNPENGELIEHTNEPVITEPTEEIIKVGTQKRWETKRENDDWIFTYTKYTLNEQTGEVSTTEGEDRKQDYFKPKITQITDGNKTIKTTTVAIAFPNEAYDSDSLNMPPVFTETTTEETIETIPSIKKYVKDDTRNLGEENTISVQGKNGTKTIVKTIYGDVDKWILEKMPDEIKNNPNFNGGTVTSEPVITEATDTIVKVAAKDKVEYLKVGNDVVKRITIYKVNPETGDVTSEVKDEVIKVGEVKYKVEYLKVGNDVVKRTTTYKVNPENGEVTTEVKDEVIKTGEVKDKVEYLKVNNDVIKRTTTYKVNPETGEITSEVKDEVVKTGEVKDKVEYLKVGNDVVKRTTTYKVNPENGEVTTEVKDEVIKTGEVKDKVEYLKVNNDVIKRTTTYKVNSETGEITSEVKDEVIKTEQPKVEHSKGTELPLKQDELPELKVAIIKDKDNNILDVIKENEEPKNIQGYVNTNKSEIDNEGHKVYIYEKIVETSKGTENPPVVNLPEFTGGVNATDAPVSEELPELKVDVRDANTDKKPNNIQDNNTVNNKETQDTTITNKEEDKVVETNKEPIANNKQTINKKDELPKTNASFFSGLGLLAGFGLIGRKKDK